MFKVYACPSAEKFLYFLRLVPKIFFTHKHLFELSLKIFSVHKHFQCADILLSASKTFSAWKHLFCALQTFSLHKHLFECLLKNIYLVLFWECQCAVMKTNIILCDWRLKMEPPSLPRVYSVNHYVYI